MKMKKKILSAVLVILILGIFTSGCSNNKKQSPQTVEKKFHEVSNTGGSFSQEDLIYFIMIDRFRDGDMSNNKEVDITDPKAYHGGDLKGITEKLDYIKSLGTTAIWITPVAENQPLGYHGYWITDFKKMNPNFGTMKDFKELVTAAHSKGIKVLLDYVVNHTAYESPWLDNKKFKDWFNPKLDVTDWNDQEQVERGWLAGLPDLNQDNPKVRKYLIDTALWWIKETGVDGFRLDTVKHVPKDFWNEFSHAIKSKHPDFFLLGEVWSGNPTYLEEYHKLGIDGMTNFPLYYGIKDTFKSYGSANNLAKAIRAQQVFSNPHINGSFIDNHDVKRFMSDSGSNPEERLRQALTFIMTYPSIPVIYYGTEIAMEGGDDPDNRRFMDWDAVETSETLRYFRKLSGLRASLPALKSVDFKLLESDMYYIVYSRGAGSEKLVVIMNVLNDDNFIAVKLGDGPADYTDLLTDKSLATDENGVLTLEMSPLETLILKVK
jgi:alpha-amylase